MKQYPNSTNITTIGKYVNENDIRLSSSIASDYNPSSKYSVGSLVMYDKVLYECIEATTGEFNRFKWRVTSLSAGLATKQDTLVSGTNIKTINGASLLGAGNTNIDALEVLTSAPSADNVGLTKIVHLATNPATKYNGYIYLIDEE